MYYNKQVSFLPDCTIALLMLVPEVEVGEIVGTVVADDDVCVLVLTTFVLE